MGKNFTTKLPPSGTNTGTLRETPSRLESLSRSPQLGGKR